jgi:hypothetical protein
VVALVPFHATDEEAVREARVMTALLERAINERLSEEDVKVLGSESAREAVRSHDAARTLGERLGAGVVIWGQILSLAG